MSATLDNTSSSGMSAPAAGNGASSTGAALSAEEKAFEDAAKMRNLASAQSMQVAEKNLAAGRGVEDAALNARKAVANGGEMTAMQKASLEASKLKNFGVQKGVAFKGWAQGHPGTVKCARAVGVTAGSALAINGAYDMFAKDDKGERHAGKGFVKMVTGAAIAYGSVRAGRA